jgi:hypothetical protein
VLFVTETTLLVVLLTEIKSPGKRYVVNVVLVPVITFEFVATETVPLKIVLAFEFAVPRL